MDVNGVNGRLTRKDLGITATHEHVILDLTAFYRALPVKGIKDPSAEKVKMSNLGILSRDCYALKDNLLLTDEKVQARELARFKAAGGSTVVDASLPGIGRNPAALSRIAKKTGLNIIMGTGFYVGETHPAALAGMSDKEVAVLMTAEISEGEKETGIKAGYIGEIGISEIFDDRERKVLRAAAITQRETGVAINVHINPWTVNGLEAADILLENGVAPQRICISHVDVENRKDYIHALLDKGVYIEFDNFGKEYYIRREVRNSGYGLFVHDTERVALLRELTEGGYTGQILLSCDVCLKNLLHKYGGWGYDHLLENVVPMMEEAGIPRKDIDKMLKENPADWLCGKE